MLDALQTTSTLFTDNTLKNRRNLRRDIERRSLVINRDFLENFRKVKEVCFSFFLKCLLQKNNILHLTTLQIFFKYNFKIHF